MPNLDTKLAAFSGVGATIAKRLDLLGLKTVRDLLFYFPFRYEDYSAVTPIDKLIPETTANVIGQIELIQNKKSLKRRMNITEALITNDGGSVKVIWFNQPFIAKTLQIGDTISLSGKLDSAGNFKSPTYEKVSAQKSVHTQGLVPHYNLTANLTQKQIRFLVKQIIGYADLIEDWLPNEIVLRQNLLTLSDAIRQIHFPKTQAEIDAAHKRLSFDEVFLLQIQSQLNKFAINQLKASPVPFLEDETKKFVADLPFDLTAAQKKAAWDIIQDIGKNKPMTRLLEGDVGSGKTIVACLAMINAALNKDEFTQSVLMVPTEILANQHYESIKKIFAKTPIKTGLISRSQKRCNFSDAPKLQVEEIASDSHVIIGTHALIQEKVKFKNLALAIIDEQHRFGVRQRHLLLEKSGRPDLFPHLLSMTATPIPRSLALALYGDLELSIINQMPTGRKKIITKVVAENKRKEAYDFIRRQINEGRQVFVVCPLIDISDKLGFKSVKDEYQKLNEIVFPDINIGILHGKMKADEKEQAMQDFLNKKTMILVSTSVIEVGVDVPNATVMMIEGADRFGLSQLHQFRGRVGRSEYQSYCLLFSSSDNDSQRLKAMETHHDGFELSKIDLKYRGPGEVYGTSQKGFPELKFASLFDYELISKAQTEAKDLIESGGLAHNPLLQQKISAWAENIHLE